MMTTLNQIRAHSPCRDGWEKLLRGLGKTAAPRLNYQAGLESCGMRDRDRLIDIMAGMLGMGALRSWDKSQALKK